MTTENEEHSDQLTPKGNYLEKSIDLCVSFDNHMVTIFCALIAGIVLLLLKEEVSLWVSGSLVLSLVCFAIGVGHTLIHIAFMSKTLLLAEALLNGAEFVPNAIEEDEPTIQAFARNQAYAQRAYASQLIYLLVGIGFGGLAVIVRLWEYAWRGGVIGLVVMVCGFTFLALTSTWKTTLRRFRPSTMTDRSK